jgi:hypothetical protein
MGCQKEDGSKEGDWVTTKDTKYTKGEGDNGTLVRASSIAGVGRGAVQNTHYLVGRSRRIHPPQVVGKGVTLIAPARVNRACNR